MGPALRSVITLLTVVTMLASAAAVDEGSPMDYPLCLANCGEQIAQCGNDCAVQGPTMNGLLCVAFCSNQNLMCAGACTGHDIQFPPSFAYPPIHS